MFSSLASFIFGSNTSATTNQDQEQQQQQDQRERDQQQQQQQQQDAENTIEVTSSTPSVTGATSNNNLTRSTINKRGKNKRSKNNRNNNNNNSNNNNKRQHQQQQQQQQKPPSITKLLTPSDDFEEELDEDDWFIVEKEDEEDSLPRTDSEEELSIVEVKSKSSSASASSPTTAVAVAAAAPSAAAAAAVAAAQRRRHHINSHSLYSGPRPQQQRNHLQRAARTGGPRHSVSSTPLSPPRSLAAASPADGGVTQSLYVVGNGAAVSSGASPIGPNVSMEESWFVTPPPCFTSIGPIHMETSPFENLLIEHPSMSVYHSIRSAQEATESFVNLDLGAEEQQQQQQQQQQSDEQAPAERVVQQQRSPSVRLDRFTAAQLKQEVLARSTQKCLEKKERQSLCRGAIKRANKVRDFQSKGNRQRRADMQHCKVVSGANNNRKCCY